MERVNHGQPPEAGGLDGAGSILGIAAEVVRHRVLIAAVTFATAALVVVAALLQPRTFVSTATFTPQSGDGGVSRLAGVAAQFGFSVPGADGGESPEFYADLLLSREIVRRAVEARYDTTAVDPLPDPLNPLAQGPTLVELFGLERSTPEGKKEATLKALRRAMNTAVDRETGVVTVSVATEWAPVSQQIVQRVVALINDFNVETRQTQARAEREFVEQRLAEVRRDLRDAEDAVQTFLLANRDFSNAPDLSFEYDRLTRKVGMLQQVVTSLAQAYEQARIDEVRNTPVLTVVQQPNFPVFPERRRLLAKGLIGILLGTMINVFILVFRSFVARSKAAEPDAYRDFVAARGEALAQLKKVLGR